jgi:hypothetical protein
LRLDQGRLRRRGGESIKLTASSLLEYLMRRDGIAPKGEISTKA